MAVLAESEKLLDPRRNPKDYQVEIELGHVIYTLISSLYAANQGELTRNLRQTEQLVRNGLKNNTRKEYDKYCWLFVLKTRNIN